MGLVDNYQVAMTNLYVALQMNAVSVEHRAAIQEAVGDDIDRAIEVLDLLMSSYGDKVKEKKWNAKKAELAVRMEYREMGLKRAVYYQYLRPVVKVYIESRDFARQSRSLDTLKEIFRVNEKCPEKRIQVGIDNLCLRLLFRYEMVKSDLDFTKALMDRINSYTREELNAALLPKVIMTEM